MYIMHGACMYCASAWIASGEKCSRLEMAVIEYEVGEHHENAEEMKTE